MSEPSKREQIILRIQRLRKLAESTHSKNEKESAMTQAARLIAEYQLAEAEIEAQTGKAAEDDDITEGVIIYETGRSTPWKAELVWGLAELNNVFALMFPIRDSISHKRGSRYRVFGKRTDMEITKYMFDTLVTMITELGELYVPVGKSRGVNPERESWCLGCVRGFYAKMKAERASVMQNATSAAMVLVNRREQIKKAYETRHESKIRTVAASKAQRNQDALNSGFRKGQTLNVNPGMGTSGGETKKLGG